MPSPAGEVPAPSSTGPAVDDGPAPDGSPTGPDPEAPVTLPAPAGPGATEGQRPGIDRPQEIPTPPPGDAAVRLPAAAFEPAGRAVSPSEPAAVDLSLPADAPLTADATDDGNGSHDGLFDSPFGFAIIPVTFALGRASRALRSRT